VLRSYADATLFGERFGEGAVKVLWLHGWARAGSDFTQAASELVRRGVGSVALDLPGFGASPLPATAGGARHYADLIAPAIAEFTEEPLVVVGHSFGGTVAVALAAKRPDVVRALVLTGAPLLRRPSSARAPLPYRAQRWLRARGLLSEARLEAARQRYGSRDYRNATGVMRDVLVASVNESYESELAALRVPVTLLWGENDLEAPYDVAERSAGLLDGASLRRLQGVGHFVPQEAPGELVDAVAKALAR
jgi:pimeloyl-ACP methyl ester carboxylesterase